MELDKFQENLLTSIRNFVENIKQNVSKDQISQDRIKNHFVFISNQINHQLDKLKSIIFFDSSNVAEEQYKKEKQKYSTEINSLVQKLSKQVKANLEQRGDFLFENIELENFEAPALVFKKFTNCCGYFQMKDEQRNGRGIEFFDSGAFYEGYFKNDKACGKGYYISSTGLIHQGYNKDDAYQGYGEWPLQESYLGEHDDNQANGYGKKFYKNGEVYQGFWKDNKRFGYGETYSKGSLINKGIYHNDKLIKQI
ncbi:hypothetical protein ABPG74_004359 [Tetrahymena malaccensis]